MSTQIEPTEYGLLRRLTPLSAIIQVILIAVLPPVGAIHLLGHAALLAFYRRKLTRPELRLLVGAVALGVLILIVYAVLLIGVGGTISSGPTIEVSP